MQSRYLVRLSAIVALAAVTAGCPDDPVPVADVAVETDGGQCVRDSDCTASGPCKTVSCQAGACVEANGADGTDCSPNGQCSATCSAGVCGAGIPTTTCAGKACGTDSCGNSCGMCAAGETCNGATGTCTNNDPCGGITLDGCCTADGRALWCGQDGQGNPQLNEYDCSGVSTPAHYCGWVGELGYYCAPEPTTGPSPLLCPGEECTDTCDGVACGYVCGQNCGDCAAGQFCNPNNTCVACEPQHCGGGCGDCDAGYVCDQGTCVPDMCALGDDGTGCCQGDIVVWCGDFGAAAFDCGGDGCGWAGNVYDCGGSGEDPSGNAPLVCPVPTPADPGPEVAEEVEATEATEAAETSEASEAVEAVEGAEAVEAVEAVEAAPDASDATDSAETADAAGETEAGPSDVPAE